MYFRFADLSTTSGDLPPNSRIQGTKFFAAACATSLPFSDDPVKIIKSKFIFLALPINIHTSNWQKFHSLSL